MQKERKDNMLKNTFIRHLFISLILISCNNQEKQNCQYKLSTLISNDSPKVKISFQNDTLVEVRDIVKDSSTYGLYTFDYNHNLRFYAFMIIGNKYRYSEEFDSNGNLIKKEGNPFLEYKVFKGVKDTLIFEISLYAFRKKYEDIEIMTNKLDTITPQYLFKSNLYTNIKCFSFKLPFKNRIKDLIFYVEGVVIDECKNERQIYKDTVNFAKLIL